MEKVKARDGGAKNEKPLLPAPLVNQNSLWSVTQTKYQEYFNSKQEGGKLSRAVERCRALPLERWSIWLLVRGQGKLGFYRKRKLMSRHELSDLTTEKMIEGNKQTKKIWKREESEIDLQIWTHALIHCEECYITSHSPLPIRSNKTW